MLIQIKKSTILCLKNYKFKCVIGKKGIKKNRIETVAHIVNGVKYKRLYETFYHPKFDPNNEIKKLTQLIAEPRQDKEFKSKNFVYEGTKKNIPQNVIDRLR